MSLLFYTAADEEYEMFVPVYIYFALRNNTESSVEIGLENPGEYKEENSEVINILRDEFGNRFSFNPVNFDGVLPGAVRFVTEPKLAHRHSYVYIGDIDILILDENIEQLHLKNMREYNVPFSNILRPDWDIEEDNKRLSGLHFAPTELQYPLPDTSGINYSDSNHIRGADENVLYQIMDQKSVMVPQHMDYRPEHGIHIRKGAHPYGKKPDKSFSQFSFERLEQQQWHPAWNGIEQEFYRERFLETINEKPFKELYSELDIEMKNILTILENICMENFSELEDEAYTYIIQESRKQQLARKLIGSVDRNGIRETVFKKLIPYLKKRIVNGADLTTTSSTNQP